MNNSVIWLHEDALRNTHPVFNMAPSSAAVLHIWDNSYLEKANYSLKRLVFIYETLCELPVKVLSGDTVAILEAYPADKIYVPATPNLFINEVLNILKKKKEIIVIDEEAFVENKPDIAHRRFHQFWKKIEKQAFLPNGGNDA